MDAWTDPAATARRDETRRARARAAHAHVTTHRAHVAGMDEAAHRDIAAAAGLVADEAGRYTVAGRWTLSLVRCAEHLDWAGAVVPAQWAWLTWDTTGVAGRGYAHTSAEVSTALSYAVTMMGLERATTVRTPAA